MKRIVPVLLLALLSFAGKGQSNYIPATSYSKHAFALPLEPALAGSQDVSAVNMNAELYYEDQVKEDPDNAPAWLNYYKAVRFRAMAMDLENAFRKRLDSIDVQMEKQVPGSFEQLYVHYWNGNHDLSRYASLLGAFHLRPADPDVLRQMAGYQLIAGNKKEAANYSSKWEKTGAMPSQLLPYAYNVLQSVSADAILLTNGEFDSYPINQQQQLYGVRPDVKLLPILLCTRPENRARIFRQLGLNLPAGDSLSAFGANYIRRIAAANPGKKFYLASSVGMGLLASLEKELYLTGLAFRYSAVPVENISVLRDNVGTRMKLDYLDQPVKSSNAFDNGAAKQLNMNYVLPLALAASQYELDGNKAKAAALRETARKIGKEAGRTADVEKLIGKP